MITPAISPSAPGPCRHAPRSLGEGGHALRSLGEGGSVFVRVRPCVRALPARPAYAPRNL